MVDKETAERAVEHLSVAIAEIFEGMHEVAFARRTGGLYVYTHRADSLRQAGEDIAALAAAMTVLITRGEAGE